MTNIREFRSLIFVEKLLNKTPLNKSIVIRCCDVITSSSMNGALFVAQEHEAFHDVNAATRKIKISRVKLICRTRIGICFNEALHRYVEFSKHAESFLHCSRIDAKFWLLLSMKRIDLHRFI